MVSILIDNTRLLRYNLSYYTAGAPRYSHCSLFPFATRLVCDEWSNNVSTHYYSVVAWLVSWWTFVTDIYWYVAGWYRDRYCSAYVWLVEKIIWSSDRRLVFLASNPQHYCAAHMRKAWEQTLPVWFWYAVGLSVTLLVLFCAYQWFMRSRGLLFSIMEAPMLERVIIPFSSSPRYSFVNQQVRWFLPYHWPWEKAQNLRSDLIAPFRAMPYNDVPIRVAVNHSHANCASMRATAHQWIIRFIRRSGLQPYEVSFSNRSNAYGFHKHYVPRDFKWNEQCDPITSSHAFVMIDVDFHTDMDTWGSFGRPLLLYTFDIRSLKYVDSEVDMFFDGKDLQMSVRGGSRYCHPLWDYSNDYVSFGGNTFQIDRKILPCHRAIVLLSPANTMHLAPLLKRLSTPTTDMFTMSLSNVAGETQMEILHRLDGESCKLPSKLWTALKERFAASKKISSGDVDSALKQEGHPDYSGASLLAGALRREFGARDCRADVAYTYQFEDAPLEASLDAPKSVDVVPNPVDAVPHVATACLANGQAAEHCRHEAIKNVAKILPPTYAAYAEEFMSFVPEFQIEPVSTEFVMEKQTKGQQKTRNQMAQNDGLPEDLKVKAFVKSEAYPTTKDPRNISNVSTGYQISLSRFTYAVKYGALMKQHWYYPGLSLEEIAKRVSEFCNRSYKDSKGLVETDFSRYDGTISEALRRNVEFAFYKRVLSKDAWRKFYSLAVKELDCPGTAGGRKYNPQGSRLSGSPLTTDGNTIISAFIDYCGNRLAGQSMEEAWKNIGPKFGDDGISYTNESEQVSKDLGLSLKCVKRDPCGRVGFLGRLFPIASSSDGSLQDPARVWYKLCFTLNGNGIPELRAKWDAFLRSDKHTHYLSSFCQNALRITAAYATADVENYWSVYTTGQWPQYEAEAPLYAAIEAEYLNVQIPDLVEQMNAAKTMEDLCNTVAKSTVVSVSVPTVLNTASDMVKIEPLRRATSSYDKPKPKKTNFQLSSKNAKTQDVIVKSANVRSGKTTKKETEVEAPQARRCQ